MIFGIAIIFLFTVALTVVVMFLHSLKRKEHRDRNS